MSLKTNSKLLKLQKSLKACNKAFYYSLLFSFISNLMMLAVPIYSLQVLDRVLSSASLDTLMMLTLVVMIALVCLSLVMAVRSFIMIKVGGWLDKTLSPLLFEHGISNAAYKRNISSSSHLQDLNSIKNFITGPAMSSLLDAPWSLIFIAVLFLIHPVIGIISVFGGVILFVMAIINEFITKGAIVGAGNSANKSMHYADTAARNAEAVEAMGMLSNVTKIWNKENSRALSLQQKASAYSAILSSVTRFLRLIIQVAVTGVGAYYVLQTQMSVGAMIASSILVGRALAPFESAIASWKGFVSARTARNRLNKSLESAPTRIQSINLPNPTGQISVENLYFVPIGQKKPTISGLSFDINPGEILAIIGPSAAGKSTIAKLLTGVWKAASGIVRLDGADVYTWPRKQFGENVGYLPQDVELFEGTVKSNIARMDENASDEDVIAAAKAANVHDLILRLSNGYETEVGTDGMILSAGQRQRIALARAFYGNTKVIILDEPNSSLDNKGDEALLNAINNAKKNNITVIIISHRLAILNVVDKILLMNNGRLADFGPRNEVIKRMQSGDQNKKIKAV